MLRLLQQIKAKLTNFAVKAGFPFFRSSKQEKKFARTKHNGPQ